ncbi:MAG TPA: arginine decarboxylase, pyruvoyl-dependent [Candidatus Wallbacteria bacterium]|nr:arginine decarboxylase, pyruvoyl-dependent [Candidatus Wallbacteria bacterium]
MNFVPKQVFFTKGVGRSKEKLQSFEMALRDAGIASFNLVRVSSILPPGAKIIPAKQGLKLIEPGQITFVVLADISTNEPNRLIASSIGLAQPNDKKRYGYLSEHHCFGATETFTGDYAEDLAASMLASTYGFNMDSDVKYDEKSEAWKMTNIKVSTRNITQSAVADKKGLWTTVVAAAVLILK